MEAFSNKPNSGQTNLVQSIPSSSGFGNLKPPLQDHQTRNKSQRQHLVLVCEAGKVDWFSD